MICHASQRRRSANYACRNSHIKKHVGHGQEPCPFLLTKGLEARTVTVKDSIQSFWRRKGATLNAAAPQTATRKTLALPSILTPYRTPSNALPKPTPVNLRRFAETPLVRRAINVLKD